MIDTTVHVNDALDVPVSRPLAARIEAGVRAALASGTVGRPSPVAMELSVTLVDELEMRGLNRRFHGVDAPTDVLAFDLGRPDGVDPAVLLGDVYVCVPVAVGSAAEHDEEPATEVLRLAIHGTLHVLGHDHPDGEDRYESEMFRLQERLVSAF